MKAKCSPQHFLLFCQPIPALLISAAVHPPTGHSAVRILLQGALTPYQANKFTFFGLPSAPFTGANRNMPFLHLVLTTSGQPVTVYSVERGRLLRGRIMRGRVQRG
ncbi:hypothetical protein VT99_10153 [Candidatus Electrothrix marina]|uniref:Uncharacterized protein n=1 Tax=Candidatus Electrothrix marina TaxID=1859130 RepID=A0A3S3QIU5_9BACT|nr:hypothetical protein VU00_13452 [Candidatus Electrothrix marina]RWX49221.1 hypothetical protein VT99_10153 [Candidatus Electrothrix marina]